ncbi:MAG: serine hydrolase [Burkholderiales bacterium]|nr:serine hydrolase [Burkholderiales bacterium]
MIMVKKFLLTIALAGIFCAGANAEVDADALGKAEGYPAARHFLGLTQEKFMVGTFSNMSRSFPHRTIRAGDAVVPLAKASAELKLTYSMFGNEYSVQEYFKSHRLTSMMILRDGEILLEEYQYDRKPEQLFTSFSMAKSVVSLAVGKALEEGLIHSLDDPAHRYVSELKAHPYGETSIRNLLRMASGVKFSEDYANFSDIQLLAANSFFSSVIAALKPYQTRVVEQGARFRYASSETAVLGLVVRGATGKSLADYVSEKIWKPLGAEADAAWMIDPKGVEIGFAYFNARLRDYGRLGAMLANDGAWNGRQIIPASYLREATDFHAHPQEFAGYGYHFWTLPGTSRHFALKGLHGQFILVHPAKRLVLVQTGVIQIAQNGGMNALWPELNAVWQALIAATPDAKR